MRNIIIFSAATGGGHNQVAYSLTSEIEKQGYNVVKIEPFKEKSKALDVFVSDGYRVLATKMPKVYGGMYKISNKQKVNQSISRVAIVALKKSIYQAIQQYKPELIISTHPLLVNVIAKLKKQNLINIPFISVVTDFIAHQSYINNNVDAYVVGGYCTKKSLVSKGIEEDKIYTFGIPVRREFHCKSENMVKDDKFTILLMGGSMGMSNIKNVVKELLEDDLDIRLIVVCGNNNLLKNSLIDKYEYYIQNKKLKVYGYTKEIPYLMDISDVIITKPGGLTTSESLAKNIPMIIPFFIPGQEEENAEFLVNEGAAVIVKKKEELNKVIRQFFEFPDRLEDMREKMQKLSEEYSLDNIVLLINKLIEGKEEDEKRNLINTVKHF